MTKKNEVTIKEVDVNLNLLERKVVWEILFAISNVELYGGKFGKNVIERITAVRFNNRQLRRDVEEFQELVKKEYGSAINKQPDHFTKEDLQEYSRYLSQHAKYKAYLNQQVAVDPIEEIKLSELAESEYAATLLDPLYDVLIVKG